MTDHTYEDKMRELSDLAHMVTRLAAHTDGAPYDALREVAAEIDCLCDHGITRKEFEDHRALYRGAVRAGFVR